MRPRCFDRNINAFAAVNVGVKGSIASGRTWYTSLAHPLFTSLSFVPAVLHDLSQLPAACNFSFLSSRDWKDVILLERPLESTVGIFYVFGSSQGHEPPLYWTLPINKGWPPLLHPFTLDFALRASGCTWSKIACNDMEWNQLQTQAHHSLNPDPLIQILNHQSVEPWAFSTSWRSNLCYCLDFKTL